MISVRLFTKSELCVQQKEKTDTREDLVRQKSQEDESSGRLSTAPQSEEIPANCSCASRFLFSRRSDQEVMTDKHLVIESDNP